MTCSVLFCYLKINGTRTRNVNEIGTKDLW